MYWSWKGSEGNLGWNGETWIERGKKCRKCGSLAGRVGSWSGGVKRFLWYRQNPTVLPVCVASWNKYLNCLPGGTVYLSGFGRRDFYVLELDAMWSFDPVLWHCWLFQLLKAYMSSPNLVSIVRPVCSMYTWPHLQEMLFATQCLLSCVVLHGSLVTRDLAGNQANRYDIPQQHPATAVEDCMDIRLDSHQT